MGFTQQRAKADDSVNPKPTKRRSATDLTIALGYKKHKSPYLNSYLIICTYLRPLGHK